MAVASRPFDRATLQLAFGRIGEMARHADKVVEISVYGGSALILTTNFRVATRDVDAVFENDRKFIREAALLIADEFGWDANWINDGVKGFLSAADGRVDAKSLFHSYPGENGPGLRVLVATPAYLFAMKCLAMRTGGTDVAGDIADIRALGAQLGVSSLTQAIKIISRYYPLGQLPPKTQLGLEEIFGTGNP